jgi:hypothetical protein
VDDTGLKGAQLMKAALRFGGIGLIVAGVVVAALAFFTQTKVPDGELRHQMLANGKVMSGVYKVYGVKDAAIPMWLAKTILHNDTNGRLVDIKVRYKVHEYSDWCSWHNYVAMDPGQTLVDLYHPIFSSSIAKLTSRSPSELQMECEYTDQYGKKHQFIETSPLTVLERHEFYFSDMTAGERTAAFQDSDTNSPLLAAWVSRNDEAPARLASIANKKAGGLGASSSDEDCIKVMAALYDTMRAIHISYQHPAVAIDNNLSYDIKLVQSLQYPRDTIQKRSGTCIDLAILYATMLNSVNITPYLVSMDGHCFPMAKLPSGKLLPVESTGVGDGYEKSMSFEEAVKSGVASWKKINQNGRFTLVDVRKCWMAGISNPELDPLPPDILEKWNIIALLDEGGGRRKNDQQPQTSQPVYANVPAPAGPAGIAGQWTYVVTALDGRRINGAIVIENSGNGLQLLAATSYSMTGADGRVHQFTEKNLFVGSFNGQQLSARCSQAQYTMDNQPAPPQGLPLQLIMHVSADGRSMEGQVSNAAGTRVPIRMQR